MHKWLFVRGFFSAGSKNQRYLEDVQAQWQPIVRRKVLWFVVAVGLATLASGCASPGSDGQREPGKQQSLQVWRSLTASNGRAPEVFARHDRVRFYFWPSTNSAVEFGARLPRVRVRTRGYQVSSSPLLLECKPGPMPRGLPGWRQALVVAGPEWRQLVINLVAELAPNTPGHGVYYRGLMKQRFHYRARDGTSRSSELAQAPKDTVVDRAYSIEETLQILAERAQEYLVQSHPNESLFVLLAPNSRQFPQPLLLDRQSHCCVWLSPVDFYHSTEPGHLVRVSARTLNALLLEGTGLVLVKNPVSSAARLGNLVLQTLISVARLAVPGPRGRNPPLAHAQDMDLQRWETWLDHHTLTHREQGSLRLLVDGERFFPRFQHAIAAATNHVRLDLYIFDNDDVAVALANQLKQRARQIKTELILDLLGCTAAAEVPPATPPATNFVQPASIIAYLRHDSRVQVRPFLNPFLSYNHAKIYLVDGLRAWLGGMNVGREYRYEWHDLMVELKGPVVESLEREFHLNWAHASLLGDLAYVVALLAPKPRNPSALPAVSTNSWTQMRLLPTETLWKPFSIAVLGALRHARNYIYVEQPYLFDHRVLTAMVEARNRGVDVRAIIPHRSDSKTGRHAELVIANYLLEHGVRVYFYPGMTHVKALLVDGWACIGSANLNLFGLRLCQEQNVASSDPAFAASLKQQVFDPDFARSYELTEPLTLESLDWVADIVVEGL